MHVSPAEGGILADKLGARSYRAPYFCRKAGADGSLPTIRTASGIPLNTLPMNPPPANATPEMRPLPKLIFMSRWLQLPLYLGLIAAQGVYVWHFLLELLHLIEAAFGSPAAVEHPGQERRLQRRGRSALNETIIMLVVLALIDVVMISNLLIMVIVGGYETFVSRMNLEGHPDQPEWLSHVNASVLKVKLATAIIGISSIHLLKTFINAANYSREGADRADRDPHHLPALGDGDRLHRPPHVGVEAGIARLTRPAAIRIAAPARPATSEPASTPSLSLVS